jgi:hypothetical protein
MYFIGPIFMWFITLFLLFAVSKILKHPDVVYKNKIIQSWLIMTNLLSMYIFYKILQVYNCVEFRDDLVLLDDYKVLCSGDDYSKHEVPATIALIFWVGVVPLTRLVMNCYFHNSISQLANARWKTDGLTDDYIDECYHTNTLYAVTVNGLQPKRVYWDVVTVGN